MMRELWTTVAATSVARAYSLAVSVFMVMIVARWLGPTGQGTVAAATTWATLFGTLGCLSLGQVAIHRATVKRGQPWLAETLGTLLVLAVIVTMGCWIVAAFVYAFGGNAAFAGLPPKVLIVAFLIVPFVVWELYGSNLLMATNQISIYNRAQLVGRTVGLILMFISWRVQAGVLAALTIAIVSQMIVACTGVTTLWRIAGERVTATFHEARALLHGAAQLHLNAVSSYVVSSLGVLIVNHYRGAAETGWYQFSVSLVNVMIVVPLAASMVLSARVAQLGPDGAWALQRKVMMYLPTTMIGAAALAAACAPWAIPVVVGPKYGPAIPVFQLSLLGLLGLTFSAIMSSQWIGRGYFWQMSVLSSLIAIVHLGVLLALVPGRGMYGAVYAWLITNGIAIIGNGVLALKCEIAFRRTQALQPAEVSG